MRDDAKTEITVARIPRVPISGHAENSIREVIAFYEIVKDVSVDVEQVTKDWVATRARHLSKSDAAELRKLFGQMAETLTKVVKSMEPEGGKVDVASILSTFSIDRKDVSDAILSFVKLMSTYLVDRPTLVCRAFLIAAESSFEILFSQLARVIYERNPSALASSDYAFTLEQLSTYSSIDDARNALITHRIERLLREGVDEWGKWLKRTINITLEQVIDEWLATREIFIRRNMLVHTDGRVTSRYIEEVRRSGADVGGLRIGQSLTPSVNYLQDSLQRLAALEALLTFRVWSRLNKDALDQAAGWLGGIIDQLIDQKMWLSAHLVSAKFKDVNCRRSIQLSIQVSGWLARKNQYGIDAIEAEVHSWDVSGLAPRYAVLKKLLLDTLSAEELQTAIQEGHVSRFETKTHPLFECFHEPYQALTVLSEITPDDSTDDSHDAKPLK